MALVRAAACGSRGRGLLAARDLQAGQLVLSEPPLLVYSESEAAASGCFCHHCTRCITANSTLCNACGRAKFCNPACAEAAKATTHTPWTCAGLSQLVQLGLDSETETQGRFLFAALGLSERDPAAFQLLLGLDGSAEDDQASSQMQTAILNILPRCLPSLSPQVALGLLAKDKKNAFGLMAPMSQDGQRRVRAYALYSQASLFNHDCLPNACRFEYLDAPGSNNANINVRILHDVSAGSEICLSYFPVNWTLKERQTRLLEDYGFQCTCERCNVEQTWSDDEEDDDNSHEHQDDEEAMEEDAKDDFPHAMFFVKYLCPVQDCGGTMAPLPDGSATMECNACGLLRTEQAFLEDLEHCV